MFWYNLDMENVLNYNENWRLNYSVEQLEFPLYLSELIDEADPVWSFLEIVREVNLNKYLKSHRGNKGHDGRMMFRVVLFAYMNGVYSLRDLEEKCRTDLRYMFLCHKTAPSFMAFQRFITRKLKSNIKDIFTEITEIVSDKLKVNTRILYIDGTSLEANARKNSFVWKAQVEKALKKNIVYAQETVDQLQKLTAVKYSRTGYESYQLEDYEEKIAAWCRNEGIAFVYGKGKHKTAVQRQYDKLHEYRIKIAEYTEKMNICGKDRNSYSKTDHDATFMHMKYDYYMHTGVFKPGYNVQIGVADGLIRHLRVGQDRSDSRTYIPFMEEYRDRYGELPGIVVADAGYGSYENYMYNLENGPESYIKYANYRVEKTAKYRKQFYRSKNLLHEENGELYCRNNRKFVYTKDTMDDTKKYLQINQNYACEDCSDCPFKSQCTKSAGNRSVSKNVILEELQEHARENLDSEAGRQLCRQRSIQAEGTFGVIKEDWKYNRIHRRGIKNVENEIYLVCLGFNLMKYHRRKLEKTMN